MRPKTLPVQSNIKKADRRLTKGIGHIQSAFGVHLNVWQILHSLYKRGCIHINKLKRLMQPFADPGTVNSILTKLKITCIIFNAEDKITLTSNGIDLYKIVLNKG